MFIIDTKIYWEFYAQELTYSVSDKFLFISSLSFECLFLPIQTWFYLC